LIIWGENSQLEYGGNEKERLATRLDQNWLSKHGCLQSTQAADWIGHQGLTSAELSAYQLPNNPDFEVRSLFLGAFFKWNSYDNAKIAVSRGFSYNQDNLKTGVWDFADIDCDFIALHHYVKWQKFGFSRIFDNLSVQIRYNMLSRTDAVDIIRETGVQVPHDDIKAFCIFQGQPVQWFHDTADSFRNRDIWKHDGDKWYIPDFLIEEWNW
jgi:hypothetical protein